MIEVNLELYPFGRYSGHKSIGRIVIANEGLSGKGDSYGYSYWVIPEGELFDYDAAKYTPNGEVYHERKDGAFALLAKVMADYGDRLL